MFFESGLILELSALPGLRRVSGRALRNTGPERDDKLSACSKQKPGKKNKRPKTALQAHFRQGCFRSEIRRARPGTRRAEASLTVEAALVLPLFLFAMYLLILPLRMMDTSRIMQQACEEVCQETVQLLYVQSLTDKKSAPAESGESAGEQEGALPPGAEKKRNAALTGNAAGMAAAPSGNGPLSVHGRPLAVPAVCVDTAPGICYTGGERREARRPDGPEHVPRPREKRPAAHAEQEEDTHVR